MEVLLMLNRYICRYYKTTLLMRNTLYYISLLLILFSCDTYVPYPMLAEEDALLKLNCTIEKSDSTIVYVSKEYMIAHEHRSSGADKEKLNSSMKFTVNGEETECRKRNSGISESYVIYHSFKAGDVIELFCSAPGLPDVSAKTTVPEIPQDLVRDFWYVVEDNVLKGRIAVDFDRYSNLHLSAFLDISTLTHIYVDGVYDRSTSDGWNRLLHLTGRGEWGIDYQLPKDYVGTDEEGRLIEETTDVEIGFNLEILSDELYFAQLHQQSSPMSPSSYTNVKGGLGCVGAINRVVIDTFKSDAQ